MGLPVSTRESLAVPVQARGGADIRVERARHEPARSPGSQAHCGACGKAWFGDVAYCPYCGQKSASAPTQARADAPQEGRAPRMRWKARRKPLAAVAAVLLVVAIAASDLAVTSDRAGPPGAQEAPLPATTAVIEAPVPPAPPAPQAPPPAPPRNRSLCSAASEAAGLCNPN